MSLRHWSTGLISILLLVPLAAAQTPQPGFSISIDASCVGVLRDASTDSIVGSGFILEDNNTVITARHVAIDLQTLQPRKLNYQSPHSDGGPFPIQVPLTAVKDVEDADIAILHIEGQSPCKHSLKRSTVNAAIGYRVIYMGFDPVSNGYKASSHAVRNLTSEADRKFIEIEGDARPGYSGGPVFDEEGNVLGMVLKGRMVSPMTSIFEAISAEEIPKPPTK